MPKLSRLTAWTIGVNLAVILWGAWVRSSGSGAGCGAHWPLCNGTVIPLSPTIHTLTEFTHRLTSGLALLLVIGMVLAARRQYRAGHPARRWAGISLGFIVLEALLGAALVKFQLVADDASIARAVSLGAHLLNTLLLLAALWCTWWSALDRPLPATRAIAARPWIVIGLLGFMLTGMTGAIVSLGDTLFPSASFAQGLAQDFSPTAHLLLRLRLYHPVIAAVVGLIWMMLAQLAPQWRADDGGVRRAARLVLGLVMAQWLIGFANIILAVPTVLQLLHLLTADLLWLSVLYLTATATRGPSSGRSEITS